MREHESIAIGPAALQILHADKPVRAWLVFHNYGLAEQFTEPRCQDARINLIPASGAGYDQAERAVRPITALGKNGWCGQKAERGAACDAHGCLLPPETTSRACCPGVFMTKDIHPSPQTASAVWPNGFMKAKAPQALPRGVHWPIHRARNARSHLACAVPGLIEWHLLRLCVTVSRPHPALSPERHGA